jgi:hypothetical protein
MPSAKIQTASTSDTIVAAQGAGVRIRVLGYVLMASGAGTVQFVSGATDLTGPMEVADAGGLVAPVTPNGGGWFDSGSNEAITLVTTGGTQINGHVVFSVFP